MIAFLLDLLGLLLECGLGLLVSERCLNRSNGFIDIDLRGSDIMHLLWEVLNVVWIKINHVFRILKFTVEVGNQTENVICVFRDGKSRPLRHCSFTENCLVESELIDGTILILVSA